ncbi:various chains-domain-containing protein [Lipomyces tetrasporus]|uniref:Various chains-domain-containing protein n=1 Tax=Lipomyces tetrasporus TaxID=54092 RepID=A0AAD7QKI4_9ASCO|nr:various chains-domain-containing protein [Lipomyces tetrasporus]KAJ8096935.1 various chains-domain-containing protein [Lipomyces tetrasporus]
MLIPVLVVSSLVHLYAMGYMEADPHQPRFFSYLSMFTFFMVILVTADNYLMLFVGWEFIGVASYLLISFWFTRLQAVKSALSAILLNRFGDTFLTIGLFATIWCFGTLDFKSIFSISNFINPNVITFISICFLLGALYFECHSKYEVTK